MEAKKRKLDLDWNKLLLKDVADEEPPPPLVVIKAEPQQPRRNSDTMGGGDDQGKAEFWGNLPDDKLEEKILRQQRNLDCFGSKLPDKGKKISDQLRLLEEEKIRRTVSREKMVCSFTGIWCFSENNGEERIRESCMMGYLENELFFWVLI